uniref:Pentatricopeptide repeat-containing protein n=1 Tax=Ananas comosus var. bracteatus TaxID=296719 RepID=A0A6V7PRX7_ANACO|nr:unnamed protein product [Ananas comosus var. bracteatus]
MSSSGDADHVLRLFREMKSFRRAPDLACYTTVVHSLVTARRPTPLSRWMARCGCPPDVVTYSTLITGLCWAGRVEEALGVLDLMLEDQCRPNVCTYTPIVHAYCSIGRIEEAKQLVNAMGAVGCPPNTVTYNVIVEALCMVGALDEVGNLINDSVSNGWKPDAITYSIYMDGLCKFGKLDKCVEVFDEMTARGLCPTTVTLNILLDCLCRGSEAWEAKYLLERSRELEWNADVANYNTVMSRLCSGGRVLAVLKLFTDMLKKGIAPNSWTFSIVVNSLCRAGSFERLVRWLPQELQDSSSNSLQLQAAAAGNSSQQEQAAAANGDQPTHLIPAGNGGAKLSSCWYSGKIEELADLFLQPNFRAILRLIVIRAMILGRGRSPRVPFRMLVSDSRDSGLGAAVTPAGVCLRTRQAQA